MLNAKLHQIENCNYISFQRMEELEHELREVRREVLNRDKVITQLRLRMPATAEREQIFASAVAAVECSQKGGGIAVQADDFEEKQAVRVAQSTIASLQVCEAVLIFVQEY